MKLADGVLPLQLWMDPFLQFCEVRITALGVTIRAGEGNCAGAFRRFGVLPPSECSVDFNDMSPFGLAKSGDF
jgi:hypothetical protein